MSIYAKHWKFKMEEDFLSKMEAKHFKHLRESGKITVFQIEICENCRVNEVPKGKKYCSLDCKNEQENQDAEEDIEWSLD